MSGDERYADLHLHSTCSDGADTPRRVVERAADSGFSTIALTDHDTVQGIAEAQAAGRDLGVEVLPGIEISAGHRGQEVHVLGYGIDPEHGPLLETLCRLERERTERVDRIVQGLNEAGVAIDLDAVRARGGGVLGRMHVAQELLERGHASSVQNAFDRYLKRNRPGYARKPLLSVRESVSVIRRAGGLAFLAHPGLGRQGKRILDTLELGFDGIEVFHSKHSREQSAYFLELAQELGLLVSGGSDCHGEAKGTQTEMGKVKLPYRYVEAIREALANLAV